MFLVFCKQNQGSVRLRDLPKFTEEVHRKHSNSTPEAPRNSVIWGAGGGVVMISKLHSVS